MLNAQEIAALAVGTKVRVYDEHFPNGRNGRVVRVTPNVMAGNGQGGPIRNIGTNMVIQFTRGWVMFLATTSTMTIELGWKRSTQKT